MIPVSFKTYDEYDINIGADVTVFTATTPKGSYFTRIEKEGAAHFREQRDKFKELVVECIYKNIEPGEVDLDAEA